MRDMAGDRIVVGSVGDDDARSAGRRLRDAGHEVIFVGARQTPEHLVRTAVSEDADRIVVHADAGTLELIERLCAELGVPHVAVESVV
jgi:methylmalonyl-CoA mutase C-terminal domain/subunit|nr:hypothetical protein [Aeromicrobium sp.]